MVAHGEPGAFEQGHMHNQHQNHRTSHNVNTKKRLMEKPWGINKTFGNKHPETLDHLVEMGNLLLSQGKLPEAEENFVSIWEGRKKQFGENHPMTCRALREVADVRKRRGYGDAAQDLLHKEACHGYATRHLTTSRSHASLLRSTQDMSSSLRAAGRLTLLQKELASSVDASSHARSCPLPRSNSEASLTSGSPTNRTRSRINTDASLESAASPRRGKRLFGKAAEAILEQFSQAMFKKYGSAELAFRAFDNNGNGTLSGSEFVTHARCIFTGDVTAVFKALDVDRGGDITVAEFDIFNQWKPNEYTMDSGTLNELVM